MKKIIATTLFIVTTNLSPYSFALSTNINTASVEEIAENLSGIGEKKAQAIVDFREKHGAFHKAEDIMQVKGIGKGIFKKIKNDLIIKSNNFANKKPKNSNPSTTRSSSIDKPTSASKDTNIKKTTSLSNDLLKKTLSPTLPQN